MRPERTNRTNRTEVQMPETKKRGRAAVRNGRRSTRARERTADKRRLFLKELAEGGSWSAAAAAAGVSRRTPYKWRDADPAFTAEVDEAEETGTDLLEDAAMHRAVRGVKRPVYQRGKLVGHVTEYSD